jgi:hypothetical protein
MQSKATVSEICLVLGPPHEPGIASSCSLMAHIFLAAH